MSGRITLTMIKPGAFKANHTAPILARIVEAGFKISAIRSLLLTEEQAKRFYEEHKGKPFYDDLVKYMSSGPIVAAILEKENAVDDYRMLIGTTNPFEAAEGTIRKIYGASIGENAVHGSDKDETAEREADFFFNKEERF
jgi:nucleoside-diphosphate kinase